MIQQKLVSNLREFKAGFLIFLYCSGKMRFHFEIKSPNENLERHYFHVSSFEHLYKKIKKKLKVCKYYNNVSTFISEILLKPF